MPARSFGILIFFAVVQGIVGGSVSQAMHVCRTHKSCSVFWGAVSHLIICLRHLLIMSQSGPVTAEAVGMRDMGSALAILWLSVVLPCTFSQAIGSALSTQYVVVLMLVISSEILLACVMIWIILGLSVAPIPLSVLTFEPGRRYTLRWSDLLEDVGFSFPSVIWPNNFC